MTYQRGDIVQTDDANRSLWMWIQPPGMAGEFMNPYGATISADEIGKYNPRLIITGGRFTGGTDD